VARSGGRHPDLSEQLEAVAVAGWLAVAQRSGQESVEPDRDVHELGQDPLDHVSSIPVGP
jgi:hypothetical protein